MGIKRSNYITLVIIFTLFLYSSGQSLNNSDHDSLDALVRDYAFEVLARPHTSVLYKVTLPVNLSGMDASVVRLRSGSFWTRGANFSGFRIPPRVLPVPFTRRLVIVYENLGNWSSYYYNVPGFSLVAPVVGFMAYGSSNLSANGTVKLKFNIIGDPISVHFLGVALPKDSNLTRCVTFNANGSVSLSEMTLPNVCFTRDQGHFSIVVPLRKGRSWKLWVIGLGFGFLGLILVGLVGMVVFRFVRMKKIGEMERQAELGEAFDTIWIGTSKMPSAPVIRTQPVLENGYAP